MRPPLKRRLTWWLCRGLFAVFFRIQVHGEFAEGPVVVAANHRSYLDGPLGFWLSPRVRPIARLQRFALWRLIFWMSDSIVWGRDPLREAVRHLRNGGALWIAPRGGIGEDYDLGELTDGAARLARLGRATLQPMGIAGSREALHGLRPWRRLRVSIVLGEPVAVAEDDRTTTDEFEAALASMVQEAVSKIS